MIVFGCIIVILQLLYERWLLKITRNQRLKPLPADVADIYDTGRYRKFLAYQNALDRQSVQSLWVSTIFSLVLLCSPVFRWISGWGTNVYSRCLLTLVGIGLIEFVISTWFSYQRTFVIDEQYQMNTMTRKKFWKDTIVDALFDLIGESFLYVLIIYGLEHLTGWTAGMPVRSVLMTACLIVLLFFLIAVLFSWISWQMMRHRYTFHELPDGPLRQRIIEMMAGIRRPVKKIEIYDESKRSTRKNAFLLKFLWIRQFGIADNFIKENSERELLAVLGHEIGHLKHKKNILNFIKYFIWVFCFLIFVWLLAHVQIVELFLIDVMHAFNLPAMNYYVVFYILPLLLEPLQFAYQIFSNYVSRKEEYEADRCSVDFGYGPELIMTFKELSEDELVDVNPDDRVEFLEYDHPGMHHRIQAIERRMKEM